MRAKTYFAAILATAAMLALAAPAQAQEKACLLEGSVKIGKEAIEIKDCLQNDGVPVAQFKETCTSLAEAGAAMGGPPAKITYLAACPAPSQGSCAGFFGQPMSSYYYKRDPKTLAQTEKSCKSQGGKWH